MSTLIQDTDWQWFKENAEELYEEYGNKHLIVSYRKVLGAYDSFDEALDAALKKSIPGEFLIQQCRASSIWIG